MSEADSLETEVVEIDEKNITGEAKRHLERAGEIIRNGGLVAFPTETVTASAEMR